MKGGRGGTAVVREGGGCRLALRKFKYNEVLKRAQDEKVIVKVERDRHTVYQPAPF